MPAPRGHRKRRIDKVTPQERERARKLLVIEGRSPAEVARIMQRERGTILDIRNDLARGTVSPTGRRKDGSLAPKIRRENQSYGAARVFEQNQLGE